MTHTVSTSYTRVTHASTTDSTEWHQGMMIPSTGTEWNSILPENLTSGEARRTNRVIKSIMGNEIKSFNYSQTSRKDDVKDAIRLSVTPATLSFVEDVTGKTAASTEHTGSAVRAAYLAGKLQMKNEKTETVEGFRDALMSTVTQLKSGGAVALARTIKQERATSGDDSSATADNYAASIANVHNALDHQISERFKQKHATYMNIKGERDEVRKQLGDWWAKRDRSDPDSAAERYRINKYKKHGIK
jgi:hypothetical protein